MGSLEDGSEDIGGAQELMNEDWRVWAMAEKRLSLI